MRRPASHASPRLRSDAAENLEKLRAAALALFRERGLTVPLEDIAREAGVSPGTLYNRFGSREVLIDDVIPAFADEVLGAARDLSLAQPTPWAKFRSYLEALFDLQEREPALSDAVSGRYPAAKKASAVCHQCLDHVTTLIGAAHEEGTLRTDFSVEDFVFLLWSHAAELRTEGARDVWSASRGRRRAFLLDGLRAPGPAARRKR